MFRRFMLVGLLSIVQPGSILQLLLATLVSLLYLTLQLQAAPFKQQGDNFVALVCSISLVILYLSSIILKLKTLIETRMVYDVLTPVLRNVFDVPVVIMSAIMLASVLGTLMLGLVVLLIQSRNQKELFERMYRDGTTGLYNKALFLEHLEKAKTSLDCLYISMDIQLRWFQTTRQWMPDDLLPDAYVVAWRLAAHRDIHRDSKPSTTTLITWSATRPCASGASW
jgi:hypothetical protein